MRVPAGLWLCAAALLLGACASLPHKPLIPVPPLALGADWKRTGVETPAVAGVPASLQALKPVQWVRTSYRQLDRMVLVQVFGMSTEASAFEARQKWRNEGNSTVFHKGNLFVVCSSETESMSILLEFTKLVENEWLRGGR
ncbi:hypothetical protein [Paludibaculum fermentans]|uniref:hypothetical protein n=1 Tax=Paludibaculum fermentans TaxID=1473598 RepID=UPI003EB8B9E8